MNTPKDKKRTYQDDIQVGDTCIIHEKHTFGEKDSLGRTPKSPLKIVITSKEKDYVAYRPYDEGKTFKCGNKLSHQLKFVDKDEEVFIVIVKRYVKPVPPPTPIIKNVIEKVTKQNVIKELHFEVQTYLPQYEETLVDKWYRNYCIRRGRMLDKKVIRETRIIDPKTNKVIKVIDPDIV
jgi:hypothetical protein